MGSSPRSPRSPAPEMVDNSCFLHGRIDPGREENYGLVEAVDVQPLDQTAGMGRRWDFREASPGGHQSFVGQSIAPSDSKHNFLSLPAEIIDHILSFLPPLDLAILSLTCRQISSHAKSDLVWQRHVQENVPGVKLTSPFPYRTYRELYKCHDPHWFIPKYKIWFSDYYLTGMLVIARYDPRRGCIEGYRLIASRAPPTFDPWEEDDEVLIHSFTPRCRLHLDVPVIHLGALSPRNFSANEETGGIRAETSMSISSASTDRICSNLLLAKPIRPETDSPSAQVWPPRIIPARHRFLNITETTLGVPARLPRTRAEVSNQAFRIRKWIDMSPDHRGIGVHLGEEIYTYSTLDPKLYTPTEEKPWRGIWVGDFSGHGCEFLLINQPDDETPFDEASVVQRSWETVEEWEKRKKEERLYRGPIEAIKLTGDPNVPRGEYTFIADDISSEGYIRTATGPRFQGARIVKSRGHIASRMFRDDKYIEGQLIMISHDRLAQYWVGFGHISFYERVNIDNFLNPSDDPIPPIC